MTADGEGLHQRQLVQRQPARGVQLARRDDELRPHPAIGVHAQHLQVFAAIARAAAAGEAFLAIDVWLDGAAIAGLHVRDPLAHRQHLHAQFMTGDARVTVERHLAQETTVVSAADTDAVDADERLARRGPARRLDVRNGKLPWLLEPDRFQCVWLGLPRGRTMAAMGDRCFRRRLEIVTCLRIMAVAQNAIKGNSGSVSGHGKAV